MKVSVILPTYNESKNIVNLIKQIRRNVKNPEIIVVDDNSPDETWKLAKSQNVKVIRRIKERGLPSAIWTGIKAAKGDIIIWMDSDLSHPPHLIPRLLTALKSCDVAIASRYAKGGKDKRKPTRVITSWLFNFYASQLLNVNVRDVDSGYPAVKRKVFDKVVLLTTGYGEYFVKFIYDVIKAGFKVKEVPYTFVDRLEGDSKTGEDLVSLLGHGLNYGTQVLKLRVGLK